MAFLLAVQNLQLYAVQWCIVKDIAEVERGLEYISEILMSEEERKEMCEVIKNLLLYFLNKYN